MNHVTNPVSVIVDSKDPKDVKFVVKGSFGIRSSGASMSTNVLSWTTILVHQIHSVSTLKDRINALVS